MSRALVISTYELGLQPLGCAVPAAWLADAGHEVRAHDLSVEQWPSGDVAWAQVVVFAVQMHTAMRLALAALGRVRATRPEVPVAFLGLYGEVAASLGVLGGDDVALTKDPQQALLAWAARHGDAPRGAGVTGPGIPLRALLPPLESYARLVGGGHERLVGAVEATEGCNHRCRHCPVPAVWNGRSRPVPEDAVLADVDQLVAAGAQHIHFADPDFLNRPSHARRVATALHQRHPGLSFDITAKVSHLVRFPDVVAALAAEGLSFIVSAFETTNPLVLARLDKGHGPSEMSEAVRMARRVGVEIRPSLMPFTPWTKRRDLVDLLDFVAAHDLVWNVDPVHYGIRLLLPPGSLLLESGDPVLDAARRGDDPEQLGTLWQAPDPFLDELQSAVAVRTEAAATSGEDIEGTYLAVRELVFDALGEDDPGLPPLVVEPGPPGQERPRLSESWFCCAEPTASQVGRIDAGAPGHSEPVRLLSRRPAER